MKEKINEMGVCPFCGSDGTLDYDCVNNEGDDMCYYKWKCMNCGNEGEEWYELRFIGHNIIDNNGEIVELN